VVAVEKSGRPEISGTEMRSRMQAGEKWCPEKSGRLAGGAYAPRKAGPEKAGIGKSDRPEISRPEKVVRRKKVGSEKSGDAGEKWCLRKKRVRAAGPGKRCPEKPVPSSALEPVSQRESVVPEKSTKYSNLINTFKIPVPTTRRTSFEKDDRICRSRPLSLHSGKFSCRPVLLLIRNFPLAKL
jgi:hypothetical protein